MNGRMTDILCWSYEGKTLIEFEEKDVAKIKIRTEKEIIEAVRGDKDTWEIIKNPKSKKKIFILNLIYSYRGNPKIRSPFKTRSLIFKLTEGKGAALSTV